jgi:hypothetical protein
VDYPLVVHVNWDWVPSGVVFHDNSLWWFDLSWGLLSYSANPNETMVLFFHDLSEGRALRVSRSNIHNHRCIAASRNKQWYMEIMMAQGETAATVSMCRAFPVQQRPLQHCVGNDLRDECRYSKDRVPLRIISKSRRRARRVLTRTHVSMTSGYATRHGQLGCHHTSRGASSHLLARGSLGATTCSMAPAPESRLGVACVLSCFPWCQLPPPSTGQHQTRHMSRGSSSCLLAQGSSRAVTCPMELYGLWAIEVNKYPPVALPP